MLPYEHQAVSTAIELLDQFFDGVCAERAPAFGLRRQSAAATVLPFARGEANPKNVL